MSTSALEPQRFLPEVADAASVRGALIRSAGGYLRNAIREPGVTCRVCAAPGDGFDRCWRCQQAHRIEGAADVVAPLTYAIAGSPSAALVRDYKNHPLRAVRERHSERSSKGLWGWALLATSAASPRRLGCRSRSGSSLRRSPAGPGCIRSPRSRKR
jgi:hypothetical protein